MTTTGTPIGTPPRPTPATGPATPSLLCKVLRIDSWSTAAHGQHSLLHCHAGAGGFQPAGSYGGGEGVL